MNDLLIAGVELMLTGMAIVFSFLALLIVSVNLMSAVIMRYFPLQQVVKPLDMPSAEGGDAGIIAAITAAVQRYRGKHH